MPLSANSFVAEFQKNPFPVLVIVLGNMVPIAGIMLWGWALFDMFYLYWIENVVIGVFTLIRMLVSGFYFGFTGVFSALFMGAFFVVHYGMFCMGHGMIMTEIFYPDLPFELTEQNLFLLPWMVDDMQGFVWAFAGIVIVELAYHLKAISDDRSRMQAAPAIMFAPYGRIIILHLVIILGGLLSVSLGFPPAALMMLVVLKIFYDITLYKYSPKDKEPQTDALA